MPDEKTWWLYLLACDNGRLYAGIALDVEARFELHRSGKGAKFTRANRPHRVLAARSFPSRSEALKAEYALKQLDRRAKLQWVQKWQREIGNDATPREFDVTNSRLCAEVAARVKKDAR